MDGLAHGEPSALQELIRTYFPVLCRYAEKFLPDSSLAKDVAQETFIKVWNARPAFTSIHSLKGFLFVTTKHGCLNLNRGRERMETRHREVFEEQPGTTEPVLKDIVLSEYLALVYGVVRTLSPAMRQVFYLSYEEGMTVSEIAAHLNMNLKTVKNHKYKTLLLLRSKFGSQHGPLLVLLSLLLK